MDDMCAFIFDVTVEVVAYIDLGCYAGAGNGRMLTSHLLLYCHALHCMARAVSDSA